MEKKKKEILKKTTKPKISKKVKKTNKPTKPTKKQLPKTKSVVKVPSVTEIVEEKKPVREIVQEKKVEIEKKPIIKIPELISVRQLSELIKVSAVEIIKKFMQLGNPVTINQRISYDLSSLIADLFGFRPERISPEFETEIEEKINLQPRPPIVTIMGHVDHGKTTLIDTIRRSNITKKEFGGITQHIGAYQISTPHGKITFIDTPGHEAFTAMRARGAQITDIVVLIVAADDGVMPQTVEAIDHAKAAGVDIIVCINKIDLPTANVQKVKQQLSNYGLIPEEWGGKTIFVEISARNNINVDKLLEIILIEAEMLELKANPSRPATAIVLESKLDSKKGPVATIIIQKGTLKIGDVFICGLEYGRIKSILNDLGERIFEAPPSTPVEILGLKNVAQTGDKLIVVKDEKTAKDLIEKRKLLISYQKTTRQHTTLEDFYKKMQKEKIKNLPLIIKADAQGSLEAILDSIHKIKNDKAEIKIIHCGVGAISDSDILLASASDAVIIGFNVVANPGSEELIKKENVEIKIYRVIYDLYNDLNKALEGLFEVEEREFILGRLEIKQVFRISKVGNVAGCFVMEGKVARGENIRIIRDGVIVADDKISSLKRFKEDATVIEKGYECGVGLANFKDFRQKDIIEVYRKEKVKIS